MNAIHQIGLNSKTPKAIGVEMIKAVKKASWPGDIFFFESILTSVKLMILTQSIKVQIYIQHLLR